MSELASPPSGAAAPWEGGAPTTKAPAPIVPEQMRPEDRTPANNASPSDAPTLPAVPPGTTPGTELAGRYRLRTRVGSDAAAGAEFWRAQDTILRRDVGATVLRRFPPTADPSTRPWHAPTRSWPAHCARAASSTAVAPACSTSSLPAPAACRDDVLGVAVTEWVPGRSLAEVDGRGAHQADRGSPGGRPAGRGRRGGPPPRASCWAATTPSGYGSPRRGARSCRFVLPRPDVTPADDVRGLGAVLYTLLTARWPLSSADAALAGLSAGRAHRRRGDSCRRRSSGRAFPSSSTPSPAAPSDPTAPPATSTPPRRSTALLTEVVEEHDRMALFPPGRRRRPVRPGRRVAGRAAVSPPYPTRGGGASSRSD